MDDVKRRLGVFPTRRRAMFLLLFGSVYTVYGIGLFLSPNPAAPGPFWWPGAMFLAGGVVTLYSAMRDRPHYEWVGFTFLQVIAGVWALNFLYVSLTGGGSRPWVGLLVWAFVVGIVLIVAGWAEPVPPHVLAAVAAYLATEGHLEHPQENPGPPEARPEQGSGGA